MPDEMSSVSAVIWRRCAPRVRLIHRRMVVVVRSAALLRDTNVTLERHDWQVRDVGREQDEEDEADESRCSAGPPRVVTDLTRAGSHDQRSDWCEVHGTEYRCHAPVVSSISSAMPACEGTSSTRPTLDWSDAVSCMHSC
jgi:hypothetical protein